MKRYNIDTTNGDLVQIDLTGESWTAHDENEEILLTLVKFNSDPTQSVTLSVKKRDLEVIASNINNILPK